MRYIVFHYFTLILIFMIKYTAIFRALKSDIIAGRYKPDTKLLPVIGLMKMFEASRCTVQHALSLLEKEGLVKGVRSQGIFVRGANDLRLYGRKRKKSDIRKVCVLVARDVMRIASSPYIQQIFEGIGTVLAAHGIRGYLLEALGTRFQEVFREINALEIDGLICVEIDDKTLQKELLQLKLPLINVEHVDVRSPSLMVLADHFHGGELAVKKLRELGHRKIVFLYGHNLKRRVIDETSERRWQGIQSAVKQVGISAFKEFIPMEIPPEEFPGRIRQVLRKYTGRTGYIVLSEQFLNTLKLVVEEAPEVMAPEMDVVAFGFYSAAVKVLNRSVWFCKWDADLMGRRAAEILLKREKVQPRVQLLPMILTRN
ncbi:MAG: hypothetical protein A2268_12695 [Candidatus Raymondbacteria bacterium RifOxyA12_full_50_37]|uniref:HTH gntR-type domain-containing protein n=1 Tax=Candidatus Raymondbacteria bacterium RIFOXYD12_FULL_49_13 TaxID=1817890 RepID=A0A1F7FBM2_UNCRA|nr:MAG: hypothetical protein A2268_12695 [Candidatus Raymondbacteria bacterium RifOxyA12_full_50_37]OGJ91034.1 MAG: hypothetical protein A2248_00715 [Candidatus Raymondbacteria bacterium RIFOXYA2_FULL_49_16]OGJ97471.1 MAG: hypothetical protein A2453_10265 [Candidatus Raymondbacteria bacterium RIFOXYC2_FULL_50_21]OGJ97783.1 MAG: hypothetical protein A2487_13200 [Candidatus Raymondbacteria bacterium RifOxyC12_full_50_8]OGJ99735.1 MAG: hypothetical protein A2350_08970 [Candidatus Raymondbacteria b